MSEPIGEVINKNVTFRNWINEAFDEIAQDVNTFLMRVRTYVLKHKEFPNYRIFFPETIESNKSLLNKLESVAPEIGNLFELRVWTELGEDAPFKEMARLYKIIEEAVGGIHAENWHEIIVHHACGLADDIKRKNES